MPQAQGVIDYRRTFLRHHVRRELRRTDDVLALEELKSRIEDAGAAPDDPRSARFLNLAEFFYRDKPDERLYIPIRIYNATRPGESYDDLSNLLERTREQPFGVLIQACSGAGKTVGCLKAFCDCLPHKRVGGGQTQEIAPRLTGYVPCWIRFEGQLPEDPRRIVNELIKRAAGRDRGGAQLRAWLEHGPPLLLFFDLNTADSRTREAVAEGLVAFQQEHLRRGHRCIVTYRSTNDADPVLQILRDSEDTPFRPFDLRTVPEFQARAYLGNIRRFEQEIRRELGLPELQEDSIEGACSRLDEFIKRHVRGSDSLISTPLLMHFISLLDEDALRRIRTIWDLYYQVMEDHLRREARYTRAMSGPMRNKRLRRETCLAVMVALAWAILSRGAQNVRLDERSAEALLRDPKSILTGFWPGGELWDGSVYINQVVRSPLLDGSGIGDVLGELLEFSLLRKDSDGIGFLHDSLIYYFFAFGARYCQGPDQPLNTSSFPEQWYAEVADHASSKTEVWEHPAEFLGGALVEYAEANNQTVSALAPKRTSEESGVRGNTDYSAIHRVAERLILAEPNIGLPAVLLRLLRGAAGEHDAISGRLVHAMGWHGSLVHRTPPLLAQECYNYLYWSDYWRETGTKVCLHFAETLILKLRERACQKIAHGRKVHSWLRQEYGSPPGTQTMDEHIGAVPSLAILPDGRVVSGSDDGTVKLWDLPSGQVQTLDDAGGDKSLAVLLDGRVIMQGGSFSHNMVQLWDPASGQIHIMDEHSGWVRSVASRPDGQIVSGSEDHTVKLWDPANGQVQTIVEHADEVTLVASLPDGRIVSASRDGTLKLCDPANNQVQVMDEHLGRVASVAYLPDGKIVSGSEDHTVKLWDPANGRVQTMDKHTDMVTSVAVLPDGRIVSGSQDKTIRLWDPTNGQVQTMDENKNEVRSVVCLTDGRIAFGSGDKNVSGPRAGKVKIWDPVTDSVQTMDEHTGAVNSVVCLSDGRVVSGSEDHTVKIWDPATGSGETMTEHNEDWMSVAFLHDGRIVWSDGRKVKLWDPAIGQAQTVGQHANGVSSLAALADGRIVSGSGDGIVKLWDPATGEVQTMSKHRIPVTSLAVQKNGRIVWGGGRRVKVWDPASGRVQTMDKHKDSVNLVASLPDGRIVSGSDDHTVKLWDPVSGQVQTLEEYYDNWSLLAFLPDGRIVSVNDGWVSLLDPVTDQVAGMGEHENAVESVATLPDGRIVTGSWDRTVKLWDPATGQVQSMDDHHETVYAVASLPDGRIVSGSLDHTVKVWDPETDIVITFAVSGMVACLACAPTGLRIAVGLDPGGLFVLQVEPAIAHQPPHAAPPP